jgi:hypothetical protein
MSLTDLQRATDDALIAAMSPGLRAAVDAALAAGARPAEVLALVRRATGGSRARPGGLTYLAVEAYLDRLSLKGD